MTAGYIGLPHASIPNASTGVRIFQQVGRAAAGHDRRDRDLAGDRRGVGGGAARDDTSRRTSDLGVHGPNGFFRRFAGSPPTTLSVDVRGDPRSMPRIAAISSGCAMRPTIDTLSRNSLPPGSARMWAFMGSRPRPVPPSSR
jgi:hypothetical protein